MVFWRSIFHLLRVEHWVKNLFVLIPAFFAARLLEPPLLQRGLLGFAAFSLVASGVYVLNDWVDAEQDRNHPDKKLRPIASGRIRGREAAMLLLILLSGGLLLAWGLGWEVLLICTAYLLVNIAYSLALKHIALIDVSLIAVGFLLRVFAGGAATGVPVSQWLIVLTFLLALILGFAKRRGEYVVATQGHSFRKALEGYNLSFLDAGMVVCSTVAIVAYLMYCFSPEVAERMHSEHVYFTAFFVILGILRYLQLCFVFNRTESPTRALLHDGFLQIVLLGWIGAFAWLLYR
jgi:decaprenyl-phosphate phosphoribosyltransferase